MSVERLKQERHYDKVAITLFDEKLHELREVGIPRNDRERQQLLDARREISDMQPRKRQKLREMQGVKDSI